MTTTTLTFYFYMFICIILGISMTCVALLLIQACKTIGALFEQQTSEQNAEREALREKRVAALMKEEK